MTWPPREARSPSCAQASMANDLWDDPDNAQAMMQRLVRRLRPRSRRWRALDTPRGRAAGAGRDWPRRRRRKTMLAEIESEAAKLQRRLAEMRLDLLMSGPHDARDAIVVHPRRRGRHRVAGLGRDAAAHVPALGRAPRLQGRDHRPDRGRRGGHQERHHRDQRAQRLRLPALGARRAPPGAHLAL